MLPERRQVDFNSEDGVTPGAATAADAKPSEHLTIPADLLLLGTEMGLDVWAAKYDCGRLWNGVPLGDLDGMVDELPMQFNEASAPLGSRPP